MTLSRHKQAMTRVLKVSTLAWMLHHFLLRRVLNLIAQRILNKAKLKFHSVQLRDMSADGWMEMQVDLEMSDTGGLPCTVKSARAVSLCRLDPVTGRVQEFATCELPDLVISSKKTTQMVLKIHSNVIHDESFAEFGKSLIHSPHLFDFVMQGEVEIRLVFGMIRIPELSLKKTISLPGMQSLQQVSIDSIRVTGGTATHLVIDVQVLMFNPSSVSISMSDIQFTLMFQSLLLGTVLMETLDLRSGQNRVSARVLFHPDRRVDGQVLAGRKLLSQFTCGQPSQVLIVGTSSSSPLKYLAPTLQTISIPTVMTGLDQPLIQGASMSVFSANPITMRAPSKLDIYNPFEAPIFINRIQGTVSLAQRIIGDIDVTLTTPIELLPQQVAKTPEIGIKLRLGLSAVNALLRGAAGQLAVDVESVIGCKVGQYAVELDYSQKDVPVELN